MSQASDYAFSESSDESPLTVVDPKDLILALNWYVSRAIAPPSED